MLNFSLCEMDIGVELMIATVSKRTADISHIRGGLFNDLILK